MDYPPKIFQEDERSHLIEVIKNFPLATIISVKDGKPLLTHLPLILKGDVLVGHLDLYNPQVPLLQDGQPITVLFSGPQCYISPSIYTTTQLPTWNYVKVHLEGQVHAVTDPKKIQQSLIAMTQFLEGDAQQYELAPDNPQMAKYLSYVHGFEITITSWEGKFKLSQNRNRTDFNLAKEQLIKLNQESIRRFLDRIL